MFHAHKSQQGFGDTEIVEKERAGVALKEREREWEEKKKKPTQPLCWSVSLYNQLRLSLFCSLHFVLFSSLLICFGFLHTVSSSSRAPDPLPAPLHPRCGLNWREAAPKAPRQRRRLLSRLLSKSGRPEAATNSSQLLQIGWAKQHASCASLLGAEPGEWGRGRRFGRAGGGWAQTEGPQRPRARRLPPRLQGSLGRPHSRALWTT